MAQGRIDHGSSDRPRHVRGAHDPDARRRGARTLSAEALETGEAPREVELKYRISEPEAVRAWLEEALPEGISAGPWKQRLDRDSYIDTEGGRIAASGYAARLRRRGKRVILTLKTAAAAAAD